MAYGSGCNGVIEENYALGDKFGLLELGWSGIEVWRTISIGNNRVILRLVRDNVGNLSKVAIVDLYSQQLLSERSRH